MSSAIEIQGLTVVYRDRGKPFTALENVSFDVAPGEFVSVIGASGCGKSTMLSVLEGLLEPTSGSVKIGGKQIDRPGLDRSVVFQQYSLFPWMTARGNVAFVLDQVVLGDGYLPCNLLARLDRNLGGSAWARQARSRFGPRAECGDLAHALQSGAARCFTAHFQWIQHRFDLVVHLVDVGGNDRR